MFSNKVVSVKVVNMSLFMSLTFNCAFSCGYTAFFATRCYDKRGLCHRAAAGWLAVECPSVCHGNGETAKDINKLFSSSSSPTIIVFPYETLTGP